MEECEGVNIALSVLVSRLATLPRVCYFDNACNLLRSIVLRCPWVNDQCTMMCDRFPYAAHTCNSNCDPSSHKSCSTYATSGAESLNRLAIYSKYHLRFLHTDNLAPFLAARTIFLNVRPAILEERRKSYISIKELRNFEEGKCSCTCARCESQY